MLKIKEYCKAESLEQAYTLNQKRSCRVMGGMLWLHTSRASVATVVDLSGLGLDQIEETPEEFSIGCMVTLRQLELHPGLAAYTNGAMRESLRSIVGVQFRNLATVGGSIWGRFGFSDVLTLFLALDSYVELYAGGLIPLEDFAARGGGRDILVRILIKKRPQRTVYLSHRNAATDFPVLTCAMARTEEGFRTVIGARPGRALVLPDASKLLSGGVTPEAARAYGEAMARETPTGSNLRGSAAYRTHLTRVLVRRGALALEGSWEDGGGRERCGKQREGGRTWN